MKAFLLARQSFLNFFALSSALTLDKFIFIENFLFIFKIILKIIQRGVYLVVVLLAGERLLSIKINKASPPPHPGAYD